jgi:hypothetical protein
MKGLRQLTLFEDFFATDSFGSEGLPSSVFFPAVTKAHELFRAGTLLNDPSKLRRVIDLPIDLDSFETPERRAVERFLTKARQLGAHEAYTALNRKAWWSVGLREPAPILATYMARRPPAFVQNQVIPLGVSRLSKECQHRHVMRNVRAAPNDHGSQQILDLVG